MPNKFDSLEKQAEDFASRLTTTVRSVLVHSGAFKASSLAGGSRSVVKQEEEHGIPLTVNDVPLLSLKIQYRCCLDGRSRFLAVEKSSISVFAGAKSSGEPLFRYEYEREASGTIPAAHIHFHTHRDAFTATMVRAGRSTKRGNRRANSMDIPTMSELHFPVGGHRFRPSLEDVLEMLIEEFGIDRSDGFRQNLRAGRKAWRQIQTKAVVRDDPASAIEALKDLGYFVQLHPSRPKPSIRSDRLEEL